MSLKKKLLIVISSFIICFLFFTTVFYFTVKPKININGDKNIVLELNDNYKEKGANAYILGKDISNDIKQKGSIDTKKVGTYKIKYSISNKFIKNQTSIIRTVKVVDSIKPEIKLTGGDTSIYIGDKYNELGYSAIDNYDGDITKNVLISNNIDNTKIGKYEIVYSVIDSSIIKLK